MKKFYLLSNEVMSGGTSFDEFSISIKMCSFGVLKMKGL